MSKRLTFTLLAAIALPAFIASLVGITLALRWLFGPDAGTALYIVILLMIGCGLLARAAWTYPWTEDSKRGWPKQ